MLLWKLEIGCYIVGTGDIIVIRCHSIVDMVLSKMTQISQNTPSAFEVT